MLDPGKTALLVIDVQEKLARLMHAREETFAAMVQVVEGARALGLPAVWCEQYPEGLGSTVQELAGPLLAQGLTPIPKRTFSCWAHPPIRDALRATGAQDVLVIGIEAHVCVYQTACDLRAAQLGVEVVTDAVSSRTPANRELGLRRIQQAGGRLTSAEMCLFELLGKAEGPAFKTNSKLVK